MYRALKIEVNGRVQGVGFRPFVYSLAKKYHLTGTVQNNRDSVIIIVEGMNDKLVQMVEELKTSPPRLSKINELTIHQIAPADYEEFLIVPSQDTGHSVPFISVDAAICKECLEEMVDPSNRRFQYPFINCTQCGPRYTIIESQPYDRPFTTMKEFTMCSLCRQEYEDPANRRHHAQPICCSECGPTVTLLSQAGEPLAENQQAITQTIDLIKRGHIIGIKGIGGYHLACDAYRENANSRLRRKKNRPQRPLAVMVPSIDAVRSLCHISEHEEEMLTSPEMPIVILTRKENSSLPANLSPGLSTIGVMLPYSPLHHLLFGESGLQCLVMTSANRSGLPIQYKDDSLDNLQEMCDYILTHNRPIHLPIDDSVIQCDGEKTVYLRRARGFAPDPIKTNFFVDQVIALGGYQKSTFALGKQNHAVMSPYIGDLENEEMLHCFEDQLHHFKTWLGVEEKYVAVDKHPFYATVSITKKLNGKIIPVQHHHAHHVSCMEDNGIKEPCFGIILDGTGYGEDGHIWGFECLYGNAASFERLAHLRYTPLPGGERAVKEPWRNAVGMLLYYWPKEGKELAHQLFPDKTKEIHVIEQMIKFQINAPFAGTCGRLFDAVSAILGVCLTSTYEGEAAIKLSDYMSGIDRVDSLKETYPFHLQTSKQNELQLDLSPMIYQIIEEKLQQHSITNIIQTFHRTIVSCCVQMVLTLAKNRQELNRAVVLSGGSFQNIYLTREIQRRLQNEGFTVYTHKNIPCHDGGLSLGQLIIAAETVARNISES